MSELQSTQILTIEDILSRYYFLEWVKDVAYELDIPTSQNKDDLIDAILARYQARRIDAESIYEHLIETLPKYRLKQIAEDNGLSVKGTRDELVDRILDSLNFEPIVKRVSAHCSICSNDTIQEMHFSNNWKATRSVCDVCGHETKLIVSKTPTASKNVSYSTSPQGPQDQEELQAGMIRIAVDTGTIVSVSIAVLFSVFASTDGTYGVLSSISLGLLSALACSVALLFTRSLWSERFFVFLLRREKRRL